MLPKETALRLVRQSAARAPAGTQVELMTKRVLEHLNLQFSFLEVVDWVPHLRQYAAESKDKVTSQAYWAALDVLQHAFTEYQAMAAAAPKLAPEQQQQQQQPTAVAAKKRRRDEDEAAEQRSGQQAQQPQQQLDQQQPRSTPPPHHEASNGTAGEPGPAPKRAKADGAAQLPAPVVSAGGSGHAANPGAGIQRLLATVWAAGKKRSAGGSPGSTAAATVQHHPQQPAVAGEHQAAPTAALQTLGVAMLGTAAAPAAASAAAPVQEAVQQPQPPPVQQQQQAGELRASLPRMVPVVALVEQPRQQQQARVQQNVRQEREHWPDQLPPPVRHAGAATSQRTHSAGASDDSLLGPGAPKRPRPARTPPNLGHPGAARPPAQQWARQSPRGGAEPEVIDLTADD